MKVLIKEHGTDRVEKEIPVSDGTMRSALQVERGVNINLNHDRFYTDIVGVEKVTVGDE